MQSSGNASLRCFTVHHSGGVFGAIVKTNFSFAGLMLPATGATFSPYDWSPAMCSTVQVKCQSSNRSMIRWRMATVAQQLRYSLPWLRQLHRHTGQKNASLHLPLPLPLLDGMRVRLPPAHRAGSDPLSVYFTIARKRPASGYMRAPSLMLGTAMSRLAGARRELHARLEGHPRGDGWRGLRPPNRRAAHERLRHCTEEHSR